MENWRFWFGSIFGMALYWVIGVVADYWAWYVIMAVAVALYFVAEYLVHKVAVS